MEQSTATRKRRGIVQQRYSGLAPGTAAAMRKVREEEGVSQSELARRLGCSQQYISKVERGGVTLTTGLVMAVAKALRVPSKRIYSERKNS